MKQDKKEAISAPAPKPEQHQVQQTRQTSGDKSFDDAIDRMLKKPVYIAPAK